MARKVVLACSSRADHDDGGHLTDWDIDQLEETMRFVVGEDNSEDGL
jgi:hypothetical protein